MPALRKLRQEVHKVKACLDIMGRSCLKQSMRHAKKQNHKETNPPVLVKISWSLVTLRQHQFLALRVKLTKTVEMSEQPSWGTAEWGLAVRTAVPGSERKAHQDIKKPGHSGGLGPHSKNQGHVSTSTLSPQ